MQVKSKVFKQRIRLKDFFIDFDKLRSGYITQAQVTCAPMPQCPYARVMVQTAMLMILSGSWFQPASKHPTTLRQAHPSACGLQRCSIERFDRAVN